MNNERIKQDETLTWSQNQAFNQSPPTTPSSKTIKPISFKEAQGVRERAEKRMNEQRITLQITFDNNTTMEEEVEPTVFGSTRLMDSAKKRIKDIFTEGYIVTPEIDLTEYSHQMVWPPHRIKEVVIKSYKKIEK